MANQGTLNSLVQKLDGIKKAPSTSEEVSKTLDKIIDKILVAKDALGQQEVQIVKIQLNVDNLLGNIVTVENPANVLNLLSSLSEDEYNKFLNYLSQIGMTMASASGALYAAFMAFRRKEEEELSSDDFGLSNEEDDSSVDDLVNHETHENHEREGELDVDNVDDVQSDDDKVEAKKYKIERSFFHNSDVPNDAKDCKINDSDKNVDAPCMEKDATNQYPENQINETTQKDYDQKYIDEWNSTSIIPLDLNKYKITSNYGYRTDPVTGEEHVEHTGIDILAPKGTKLNATRDGIIKSVVYSSTGKGNHVIVDIGHGLTIIYSHMDTINVKKGQKILKNENIGTVGKTGKATGSHLHFEIMKDNKYINPLKDNWKLPDKEVKKIASLG